MSAPPPEHTPRRSFAYRLIVLRIGLVELGRSLELNPKYSGLSADAFTMATQVADELRAEARL